MPISRKTSISKRGGGAGRALAKTRLVGAALVQFSAAELLTYALMLDQLGGAANADTEAADVFRNASRAMMALAKSRR